MYCSVVGYTVTEDDGLGRNGVIERVNVAVYFFGFSVNDLLCRVGPCHYLRPSSLIHPHQMYTSCQCTFGGDGEVLPPASEHPSFHLLVT